MKSYLSNVVNLPESCRLRYEGILDFEFSYVLSNDFDKFTSVDDHATPVGSHQAEARFR